jgi:peptidyl-prolyl cis-trans isomerase A (cyclophilin A)
MGTMKIELFEDEAPLTCENFLKYVRDGFYDGTIFHRVIPNFVLQGGGMDENMREKKTAAPIKNEADNGLKNLRGSLSMARTQAVDSATSQFFINLRDNAFLDVMDAIAAVPTGNSGFHQDVPREPVIITRVFVEE